MGDRNFVKVIFQTLLDCKQQLSDMELHDTLAPLELTSDFRGMQLNQPFIDQEVKHVPSTAHKGWSADELCEIEGCLVGFTPSIDTMYAPKHRYEDPHSSSQSALAPGTREPASSKDTVSKTARHGTSTGSPHTTDDHPHEHALFTVNMVYRKTVKALKEFSERTRLDTPPFTHPFTRVDSPPESGRLRRKIQKHFNACVNGGR